MYVRDGGADGVYVRRSECGEEKQDGEQAAVALDVRRFGRGRCSRCTAAACAQLERGRAMDDANDERELQRCVRVGMAPRATHAWPGGRASGLTTTSSPFAIHHHTPELLDLQVAATLLHVRVREPCTQYCISVLLSF